MDYIEGLLGMLSNVGDVKLVIEFWSFRVSKYERRQGDTWIVNMNCEYVSRAGV